MREWAKKIFKKEPKNDKEKKFDALQVWGNLDALERKAYLRNTLFQKLDKGKVPDGLKEWKHYNDMGESFKVDLIRSPRGELDLRVTSGSHYFRLITRNPGDLDPIINEGRLDTGVEIPIQELKEQKLKFAFYFSRFVFHHWRQAHPQVQPTK